MKIFLIMLMLISHTASAQLIDTLGGLGISGAMTRDSMGMMQNALHSVEAQDIINKIQLAVIDYKTSYNRSAKQISSLAKYNGKIESVAGNAVVTLFHVKQSECKQMAQMKVKNIKLNNGEYNPNLCKLDNEMKFIFE